MRSLLVFSALLLLATANVQCVEYVAIKNQDDLDLGSLQESMAGSEFLLPAISDSGVNMDNFDQLMEAEEKKQS